MKYSLDDLAAVCSGYPLVSSKLALPLDQKENWDSPYSHVNAQN